MIPIPKPLLVMLWLFYLAAGVVVVVFFLHGMAMSEDESARRSALVAAWDYGLRGAEITATCVPTVRGAEKCFRVSGAKDDKPITITVELTWIGGDRL